MNIEKLSLQPQEIDKHTGRIILPKSQEELERLVAMPSKAQREKAAQMAPVSGGVPVAVPEQAARMPLRDKTQFATVTPSLRSPQPFQEADFPAVQEAAQEAAPQTQPQSPTALMTDSTQNKPATIWSVTPLGVFGLCALLLAIPLGLFVTYLVGENRRLNEQYDALTDKLTQIERATSTEISLASAEKKLTMLALEKELGALRGEISQLNLTMDQFEVVPDEEPIVEEQFESEAEEVSQIEEVEEEAPE